MACSIFGHLFFALLVSLTFPYAISSWPSQSAPGQSAENRSDPGQQVERAVELLNQQDYRGAVNLLKSAARSFEAGGARPELARVWNMLGIACRRMAEYDEAAVWLNKALHLAEQIK
ncbi:MAG TPA: tetratricopeptide repeat protein, partial [Blastocatellia bacterium]|nr:tetratricopeptide repeat protein [Blastocatellia bacterium]